MLEISVLGSGSGGNCAVIRCEKATLLLDAGLSAKQINLRLEAMGLGIDDLDGIVLTHEHGDHSRGIDVFCRKRVVPIYCSVLTREILRDGLNRDRDMQWRLFEAGDEFRIGELQVRSFPVPHDAVDPAGFVISDEESALGVLSDVGHVTELVRDHLRTATSLFVEANYDDVMLQNDTKRPWSIKQRISSRHGHLSNDQTAELVAAVATPALRQVVLGHLSGDCNDPAVACGAVEKKLHGCGFERVAVECARQDRPTAWLKTAWETEKGAAPEPGLNDASKLTRQEELFASVVSAD